MEKNVFLNRSERTLELIREGYDVKEIMTMQGYRHNGSVYSLAKRYGLKVVKANTKRTEKVIELRKEGHSYSQIAKTVEMSKCAVGVVVKKAGLKDVELKVEAETRRCELCGKEFTAPAYSNKKFCSADCERKANREKAKNNTDADDSHVQAVLDRYHSEFEYVGGYAGNESRIDIKCKKCGTVRSASYISVRHRKIVCECCAQEERERARQIREAEEKEKSRIQKIVKEFNRPVKKTEQIQMKTCQECGAFYFGRGDTCRDCAVARQKRADNRRRDLKKRGSHTAESKLISARTLYERDGGVCWICGGMCDINADPNSDLYPSVDHIIPQSLGGKDTLDNVRLAHRFCNSIRSNRTDFENFRTFISPYAVEKI